jgi:serine/threonine protein kinase
MQGGKLLGTGSSSCVFSPNIPCKTNGKVDNNRVSKLLFHHDSKNLANYEKKQAELIKKIKGYKDWAIVYDEYCIAPNPNVVEEFDPEGYNDCFKDEIDDYWSSPYDKAELLNSDNGGRTLKELFNEMFSGKLTMKIIDTQFKVLMKMFIPLFKGLKEMDKHNIVHNDIKNINITGDLKELKYIDFGLAAKSDDFNHFIGRSESEGNTKRIYYYYPLEYIFFSVKKEKLQNELESLNIKNRRNYNILFDIYDILGYDLDESCIQLHDSIKNSEYTIEDIIKKIDVYSLGIQVPLLFLNLGFNSKPVSASDLISDFYDLFKRMVDPHLHNRLTAKDAYNIFMGLIKKHNITVGNKKMKLTPRRRKSTQRRKETRRRATARRRRRETARRATPRRKETRRRATVRRATVRRATPRRKETRRRATVRRATVRRATQRKR